MKISLLTFNAFAENTYILSDETGECIIVDAGCSSQHEKTRLEEFIAGNGLKPVMAVNTHGHVDHMLGAAFVRERFGIPFALHGEDRFLVESAREHGSLYGFRVEAIPEVDIDLAGRESIEFGRTALQIIHTPGHTPGHVCLYNPQEKVLLSGDTLFRESIGRTDLPGGDYSWIMRSILERLIPLGDEVKFFPGHGPDSTIGHEVLYNPFVTEILNGDVKYQ